jgi:hypothetical protein
MAKISLADETKRLFLVFHVTFWLHYLFCSACQPKNFLAISEAKEIKISS